SMVDVLPWLLRFPNPVRRVFRDFQALNRELHSFVRAKVAQHRQTFNPHALRDVSDVMIAAVERGDRSPEGLGPEDVEGAMTDIFGAGQDTSLPPLPLLEAFIDETLRYSSFVPITIPHATTDDVELEGFHIPKGTVVFINQWSVNHDCGKWPDPCSFHANPAEHLTMDCVHGLALKPRPFTVTVRQRHPALIQP
ncbi:PREDICTED: cytochrome P450 1B1-like, partial [Fulmarus glacialis]|uniref:cytochrome P450 1B1-like n=1 Tax=Fulmarus glacialis TaxID=30455 RepID=UPI00051CA3F4